MREGAAPHFGYENADSRKGSDMDSEPPPGQNLRGGGRRRSAPVSDAAMTQDLLEVGQTVRWRGRRWRVLAGDELGFAQLVGVEAANRDQIVTPLLLLEGDDLRPDELPLPELN